MQITFGETGKIFTGEKFVTVKKAEACNLVSNGFNIFNDYTENLTQLINELDQFASQFGYEFSSFTAQCVVFKKISQATL